MFPVEAQGIPNRKAPTVDESALKGGSSSGDEAVASYNGREKEGAI
jgi:hypothetical protein